MSQHNHLGWLVQCYMGQQLYKSVETSTLHMYMSLRLRETDVSDVIR